MDEDDILMSRLRSILSSDSPPAHLLEQAKGLYGLRNLDAELAALTADSAVDPAPVTVRDAGPAVRLLTFEAPGLAIEIEIEVGGTGRFHRVLGQLEPPGPAVIEIRQPSAPRPRRVDVDVRGRFVIEDVAPEPISLTCHRDGDRPVRTEWTGVA
jgi:hypothetical protein